MAVGFKSHMGLVRKDNEDCYFADEELGLFVVADGMGGHENGALASKLAVETFVKLVKESERNEPSLGELEYILNRANEFINHNQYNDNGKIMGTTLTAIWLRDQQAYVAHIGDSRAYMIRDGEIKQLTHDHTYFAELARSGEISKEQLVSNGLKNVLMKALGPEKKIEGEYFYFPMSKGDQLILCTDGLYNLIQEQEMVDIIYSSDSLIVAAENLINLAIDRGGFDNLTAVVYDHE